MWNVQYLFIYYNIWYILIIRYYATLQLWYFAFFFFNYNTYAHFIVIRFVLYYSLQPLLNSLSLRLISMSHLTDCISREYYAFDGFRSGLRNLNMQTCSILSASQLRPIFTFSFSNFWGIACLGNITFNILHNNLRSSILMLRSTRKNSFYLHISYILMIKGYFGTNWHNLFLTGSDFH